MVSLKEFEDTLANAKTAKGEPYTRKSIKDIVGNLARFMKQMKVQDVGVMLKDPQGLFEHLARKKYSPNTLRTYVSNAYTATRVLGLPSDTLKMYETTMMAHKADVDEQNLEAEYPQTGGVVPWPDIVKWAREAPGDKRAKLVRALYTMIPPRRAEYRNVLVYAKVDSYENKVRDKSLEHAFDTKGIAWNFVDMSKRVIVLRDYKTSSRHGVFAKELPDGIMGPLEAHIGSKALPSYMFTGEDGISPMSQQGFTDLVKRAFSGFTNMGIRELRICRVTYAIEVERLLPKELKALSDAMGHTLSTQQTYRRIGLMRPDEIRKNLPKDPKEAIEVLLAIVETLHAKILSLEGKHV